jgi:hypothetical protein
VLSLYSRRHKTISNSYKRTGLLHTMERILGIPPMNQMDAMSPLMSECFTNVPDFTSFTALPNNIPLDTMNPGTTNSLASLTSKERYWAKKSMKLDLSKPDQADEDVLNRAVWYSIRGEARYPREVAGARGKGLRRLGLRLIAEKVDKD